MADSVNADFFQLLRRMWRGLSLPRTVRKAAAPFIRATFGRYAAYRRQSGAETAIRAEAGEGKPGPLVVAAFYDKVVGIGRAGRLTFQALHHAGLAPQRLELDFIETIGSFELHPSLPEQGGVFIAHCNPPEYAVMLAHLPKGTLDERYRIGCWAWEEPVLPRTWARVATHFHEIWVPSEFVAGAVRAAVKGPYPIVRVMPHPVRWSHPQPDRARFGLPEACWITLLAFDMRSTRARKNPDGGLDAWFMAFPEPVPGALLLIKVVAPAFAPAAMKQLIARCAGRSDIRVITESISDGEMDVLIASIDAVLSLHRSEGYGLLLSEAMHAGKVVIATDASGSADFITAPAAIPIPARQIPVNDPTGQYGQRGSKWADPDLDAAAAALRRLAFDAAFAQTISANAPEHIRRHESLFFERLDDAALQRHLA